MQTIFLIILFIVGACLGSFLCCQARRLHLRTSNPKAKQLLGPRSVCLNCRRQLKWYDNLPIISWVFLWGKCRYCHHKIGIAEVLSEFGLGLGFVGLGTTFNIDNGSFLLFINFIILLFFTTIIWLLAVYDGLYGELPVVFLYLSIIAAFILLIVKEITISSLAPFSIFNITNPLLSVLILGGLYLVLYLISKGKWVGDGDWILATAIAIVLFHPWLSINALFAANLTACIVMLPRLKQQQTRQVHLGPFLVIGFIFVYSISNLLLGLIGN